jgi:adenylate cyclase
VTRDEAARLTGESVERVRRWQALGLVGGADDDLTAEDVERVRLVGYAARQGVPPEELARICAEQGDMLEAFVRWAIRPGREVAYTREEIVERTGIEPGILEQVLAAAGLHELSYGYDEDVESLQLLTTALKIGLPVEALLQILRVLSDSLNKVSETMTRVFHLYVHEQLRASGLRGAELMATTQNLADPMTELVEPAVMYFHRRAWERANREDMVLHLMEETTPPSTVPGELVRTILFVDLSSFTPLTEAMGDAAAARIVGRFSDMVRETAAGCDGQVLKQIGDEFMLVFPTPTRAVSFGTGIHAAASAEPRFPALRIGAHSGSVLYREGDYVGANVNLAARVTSAAKRSQFVVTDAVRRAVDDGDFEFISLGPHGLKGVSEPVDLFEARSGEHPAIRAADPVCGMELDEASAEAHLAWEGRRLLFCSEGCLRRFVENPDRYPATPAPA